MQIEEGAILNGKVTGLTDFGAFVELEGGKTGMIHISEVASNYVKDIKDHLSVGQEVKAKVITVSPEGKISLSIKKAQPEPEKPKAQKPKFQKNANRGWQGKAEPEQSGPMSFEDMMAKFKAQSEDKMSDIKRSSDRRGGNTGYRRGNKS